MSDLLFLINRCCGGVRRELSRQDNTHQLYSNTTLFLCLIRLFQVLIHNAVYEKKNQLRIVINSKLISIPATHFKFTIILHV